MAIGKNRKLYYIDHCLTPHESIPEGAILCEKERIIALGGASAFMKEPGLEIFDMTDTINVMKREFGRNIAEDVQAWWFDQLLGRPRYKYPELYKLIECQQKIAKTAILFHSSTKTTPHLSNKHPICSPDKWGVAKL